MDILSAYSTIRLLEICRDRTHFLIKKKENIAINHEVFELTLI